MGTVSMDVVPVFHPPSLRNPEPVPVDDPMERSNKYLDVLKRIDPETVRFRFNLLKHQSPVIFPMVGRTAVPHVTSTDRLYIYGAKDVKRSRRDQSRRRSR